jgi:trehalose-6-phosphate synthase
VYLCGGFTTLRYLGSEFTGCGRVLVGAIPVNPWQQPQLVQAIENALTMRESERMSRYIANMEVVQHFVVKLAVAPL